jgi:hypothetical protein
MKLTKRELTEIINSNGELIGSDGIPTTGADLESQANNTTDYNAKVGQQPFRYDMLGRFGFTLLPFFEGEENQEQLELFSELQELMYERYVEILKFYYKNPNKLKSDYRKISDGNGDINKEVNSEYAKKIIKIVEKHFEDAFEEPNQIDEAKVVEDKVIGKKSDTEMTKKSEDMDVREKKLEKIADLINKLDKKDIDKLKNLLERK